MSSTDIESSGNQQNASLYKIAPTHIAAVQRGGLASHPGHRVLPLAIEYCNAFVEPNNDAVLDSNCRLPRLRSSRRGRCKYCRGPRGRGRVRALEEDTVVLPSDRGGQVPIVRSTFRHFSLLVEGRRCLRSLGMPSSPSLLYQP